MGRDSGISHFSVKAFTQVVLLVRSHAEDPWPGAGLLHGRRMEALRMGNWWVRPPDGSGPLPGVEITAFNTLSKVNNVDRNGICEFQIGGWGGSLVAKDLKNIHLYKHYFWPENSGRV